MGGRGHVGERHRSPGRGAGKCDGLGASGGDDLGVGHGQAEVLGGRGDGRLDAGDGVDEGGVLGGCRVPDAEIAAQGGQGPAGGVAIGPQRIEARNLEPVAAPAKAGGHRQHGQRLGNAFGDFVLGKQGDARAAGVHAPHGVGLAFGIHDLEEIRDERLHVRQGQIVVAKLGDPEARFGIRLLQAGLDRRIEQALGGADGISGDVGAAIDGIAKQGETQIPVGNLDGVIPHDHIRIGRVGGERGEHRVALRAGGGGGVAAQRAGGLGAHPRVRLEGLVKALGDQGQGGGVLENSQRLAGTLAAIDIGAGDHGAQGGQFGGRQGAGGQFDGGVVAHHRIKRAQGGDQLGGGEAVAIQIKSRGGNRVGHLGRVERVGGDGVLAGDIEPLQRQRVGEDITGGRVDVIVAALAQIGAIGRRARAELLLAVIDKRAVGAAFQIEVPAHGFQILGHRQGPAHVGPHRSPQVAEALAGMTVFAAVETGGGHAGEVFGFHTAGVLQAKQHRAQRVLAIRRVARHERLMFAVGNRPLVGIPAEEIAAAQDRRIDFRVNRLAGRHQCLLAHDDGDVGGQPGLVDRAVGLDGAVQAAVGFQERTAVAVGAVAALDLGEGDGVVVDAGEHAGVARAQGILAEKNADVTPIPDVEARGDRSRGRQRAGKRLQTRLHRGVIGIGWRHPG